MIAGLDHIAIAVVDLDSAVDGYSRLLGRDAVRCDGDGAARAWFRLANMSLELVAPLGEGTSGDRVRARLASHGEGQWLMAFAVDDLAAAQRLLARRGVPSSDPAPLACPQAGRQAIILDPEATGGLQSVLVDTSAAEAAPAEAAAAVTGLDHVVVNTPDPQRAVATYAGRLGLDLRLDRSNAAWGVRQLFFRAGPSVVEMVTRLKDPGEGDDSFGGLAWRVADADAARARIAAAGFDVSEVRTGRKPGTRVFTVRSGVPAAPALMISADAGAGAD